MKRNFWIANLTFLVVLSMLIIACDTIWQTSKIQGRVVNPLSNEPVSGVTVVGTTRSNIAEEQNQVKIVGETNKKGEFLLKGALPEKEYTLSIAREPYVNSKRVVVAPEKGKTVLCEEPLFMLQDPGFVGLFAVNMNRTNKIHLPKKHESYLDFNSGEVPILGSNDSEIILIHCRTSSNEESISAITLMKVEKTKNDNISLDFTKEKIPVKSFRVGKGIAGEVLVLKATIPKINSLNYYGAYTGFFRRQTYVFGVEPMQ
ncbi:MAG: carboxypeptidase regulatory-like domain-containing protein [Candidatus Latescibacteria bacterium]|jgi:hypothetical protein|nr:carboxypeptidase regulatory-like domain-containing protein [Candidatus Latescibacterota bacterium]